MLHYDPRIRAPRPPEIVRAGRNCVSSGRGDGAPVQDIPRRVGGRRASGGGDVARACSEDPDVDALEPGSGVLAEDEIGGAFDVGFGVELGAVLCQYGVLEAFEGAAVVALVAGIGTDGEGLGAFAEGVDDVDVVESCVGAPVANSG